MKSSSHISSSTRRFAAKLAPAAALVVAALLSGCENTTQTTSGQAYLDRYPTPTGGSTGKDPRTDPSAPQIDRLVAEVAAIEPQLRFPARIGLARIENGRLIDVPPLEGETWLDLREKLGSGFGEFVALNRVVTEMAYSGAGNPAAGQTTLTETMARIRLGAARQHLDAVLVYEVAVASDVRSTGWSIIDWTIVGAYARTRRAHAEAYATALLIDVRNGYPYGTATAAAEDERATATFGSGEQRASQRESVTGRAVTSLAPEVETMFQNLRAQAGTSSASLNR
ncbi:MAG: hypothetical protein ACREIA_27000 [Opitutaceae bacterium]